MDDYYRHEILERAVNRPQWRTRQVTHEQILDIGAQLAYKDVETKSRAKTAKEGSSRHHDKALMKRAVEDVSKVRVQSAQERQEALKRQSEAFQEEMTDYSRARDRLEEDRLKELRQVLDKQHQEQVDQMQEDFARERIQIVEDTLTSMRHAVRDEYEQEKKEAIEAALAEAQLKFQAELAAKIRRTRHECEEAARLKAEQVAREHQAELDYQAERYRILQERHERTTNAKDQLENDFRELQEEFGRFIDNTPKFQHNYLLRMKYLKEQ